jgi:2'-5' RNA ligase
MKKSKRFQFGCLMGKLSIKNWHKLFVDFIEEDDVYGTKDSGFGMEDNPHVTILFGFHDEDKTIVANLKKNLPIHEPINCTLDKVSIFETEDYDVVKFDVLSDELAALNSWCKDNFDYSNDYPTYHAHATIAYVKKGTGKKYKRNLSKNIVFAINELIYSHPGNSDNKREAWKIN